ncbi:MAG: winged helix-turn-helix domain-containing protein [Candidatus Methanofishera endochildressiae]|uniref:Winged helix-turn-helix domain-containing protein n=1 Tax=Candidatus Methanofishera endochildressiae TaxID=2738884 RepID=A0A7Z0MNF4_9GAMM|nr:winged helix-turn-helix domain-containing protein [Candidatus Methanofishera endochildressiae]
MQDPYFLWLAGQPFTNTYSGAVFPTKPSHAEFLIFTFMKHLKKGLGLGDLKHWVWRIGPLEVEKRKFPNRKKFKEAVITLQEERVGGRITGHDIRQLLDEQFQIKCCLNSVYNLLARLNIVWITVRSKHPKQDQTTQDDFKKTSVK